MNNFTKQGKYYNHKVNANNMSQFINLNNIIGNGKSYLVPKYQRDYSWGKEDWEDLWNDILEITPGNAHYLGYLVLQPVYGNDDTFWIIDGQQRLTTCSLLALAVTALLKKWVDEGIDPDDNKIRWEKETERYLGNYSTSKLTLSPKLTLNRNNDDYYKSWLMSLRPPPSYKALKPSQRLLQKSFDYFLTQLEERFDNTKSGAELVEFLEKTVGAGLVFTTIYVEDDLNAFKVFETLNARGVKLSPADLLKNYLFSQVVKSSQLDLEESERRWNNISDSLRNNDITTYLRHFWNSRHKLTRQTELFKAIQKDINGDKNPAAKALTLLNDLENQVVFYTAFSSPNDEIWNKDEREHLQVLTLLEVSTCFSLMLAVLTNVDRQYFKTILRELAVIVLRYNLSGRNPNEAERVFSDVANAVSSKALTEPRAIITALKSIYVTDDLFATTFTDLRISTRRKKTLVKYLLVAIENQLSGSNYHFQDATASIEHILPEKPGKVWEDYFSAEEEEEYKYRIGNYTLLQESVNNKLDNDTSFAEKLTAYKKSKFKLSSEYCLYDSFTPETLTLRQERIAKTAKSVWKSAYLQ
jgi:uncharacterized protein with ParB-like and HNH nuclease domain